MVEYNFPWWFDPSSSLWWARLQCIIVIILIIIGSSIYQNSSNVAVVLYAIAFIEIVIISVNRSSQHIGTLVLNLLKAASKETQKDATKAIIDNCSILNAFIIAIQLNLILSGGEVDPEYHQLGLLYIILLWSSVLCTINGLMMSLMFMITLNVTPTNRLIDYISQMTWFIGVLISTSGMGIIVMIVSYAFYTFINLGVLQGIVAFIVCFGVILMTFLWIFGIFLPLQPYIQEQAQEAISMELNPLGRRMD